MDNYYKDFCFKEYNRLFAEYILSSLLKKSEDKRKEAQKRAIKEALINAISKFSDVEPSEIWKNIHAAHIYNISGISDLATVTAVLSAENSWKKSSGHAFEETIKELGNTSLKQYGIEIILQRDLSFLLFENRILNEVRDISWLKEQIATSAFDLYLTINQEDKYLVFGCVQSKTSIRDRVTRDREPSMIAMSAYFMSVAIVLDGDFLRLPKFRNMVNGNSSEYPLNGWHGMYVLSNKEIEIDRIHTIDVSMENFVRHVIEGSKFWTEQRQWFNYTWKPQNSK
jgi:hypothetical protein